MKLLCSSYIFIIFFLIPIHQIKPQQQISATLAGSTTSDGFLVEDNSNIPLLRVRGDGNVSIGTATPSITSGTGLHIYGSNDATIKVEGNSTGNNNAYFNGTPNDQGDMYVTNDGDGDLYLGVGARDARHLTINPSGNVGIGTITPDASAILDVRSTTQGILIPQMTKEQRKDIVSPATGLLVFQTDETQGFYYYTGTEWNIIGSSSAPLEIGDYHEGGIIFYLDGTGEHGLIAATTDQSTGIQWTDGSYVVTGATGTAVGTGQSNTTTIVSVQGAGNYAAKICDDLVLNSYSDWFLPSKDELNLMYQQRTVIGGFSTSYYWSSSEYDIDDAWAQGFNIGDQNFGSKGASLNVRAIRQF